MKVYELVRDVRALIDIVAFIEDVDITLVVTVGRLGVRSRGRRVRDARRGHNSCK